MHGASRYSIDVLRVLGFQECNANCIAMVDDDDVRYMIIQEEDSAYVAYTSLLSTQNTLILTSRDRVRVENAMQQNLRDQWSYDPASGEHIS